MNISRKTQIIITAIISISIMIIAVGISTENSFAAYSNNGYKTYVNADVTKKWTVADQSNSCSAMQGMNVGTDYIYTAKIKTDNNYQSIIRTKVKDGTQTVMSYYSSLSATSASSCNALGHANALSVAGADGISYLFAATTQSGHALCKLKIDGTKLYKTGYFNLVTTAGTSIAPGGIKCLGAKDGYFHFLIKANMTFYRCSIKTSANGGSSSAATKVTCYKVFTIDTRNAIFATSNSATSTVDNLETWINQDFSYCSEEKSIYVPLYDGGSDNVILGFDVTNFVNVSDWPTSTKETTTVIFPSKTTCHISGYEIESVGFRTGQGTDGDRKMYFCTNGSPDGIYTVNMPRGTTALNSIYNPATNIAYSVSYEANGGVQSDSLETRDKMTATRHIVDIVTRLRPNKFTRSGYTFGGWHLYREVTGKPRQYLYNVNGTVTWYEAGKQPADAPLAIYANKQKVGKLAAEKGTKVYCVAQWNPNATGTQSFYVHYEANGGTGTMADTKITYGTTTATRKNAFTRDGYIFSGWLAHRKASDTWSYTSKSDLADTWIASSENKTGYFKKTYNDGCNLAKTSGTDADIVTFYACWSRFTGSLEQIKIKEGEELIVDGNIESNTDFYDITVTLKDSEGTVLKSANKVITTSTYAVQDIISELDIDNIAVGHYSLNLTARTRNTASAMQSINFGDIELYKRHAVTINVEKEPTCVTEGLEGESFCTYCNIIISGGEIIPALGHDYQVTKPEKAATCTDDGNKEEQKCSRCADVKGGEKIESLGHDYKVTKAAKDATCTENGNTEEQKCSRCAKVTGGKIIPDLGHDYKITKTAKEATCKEAGYTAEKVCKVCDYKEESVILPADKHTAEKSIIKATLNEKGIEKEICTVCKKELSNVEIAKVSSVKLAVSAYTYNGKSKSPAVTVKNSAGTKLVNETDFKVTYGSGRKKVGTYKVTVSGIGKYEFTKILNFNINPVKTSISSLSKGKKSFTVKWAKKTAQITGYEIQYSTSSKFKKGTATKTVKVTSAKTTKKTIKKLKSKKKYYVRVRTYKTVNSVKYYSAWCTKKYVKTK